jgi:hypothetical protein
LISSVIDSRVVHSLPMNSAFNSAMKTNSLRSSESFSLGTGLEGGAV